MTGLFVTVLNMSLIASLTALVVLLIRWCLKGRAPRWISYALWAVVLIRLLVPVSVSSPVPVFPGSLPEYGCGRAKRPAVPVGCYRRRTGTNPGFRSGRAGRFGRDKRGRRAVFWPV